MQSSENERTRLTDLAGWYRNEQLGIDRSLIGFRYRTFRPHLRGPEGLELGPADGTMTALLSPHFRRLTVVDGAAALLEKIPDSRGLEKICCLFEAFIPERRVNTVVLDHVLEHVEDPAYLLRQARDWVGEGGRILLGVPNAHSLHRLAGVFMGLLSAPTDLNQRDQALGHRRVFTPDSFTDVIRAAGLHIIEEGGVFLKPLTQRQIEKSWSPEMIEAFYELGKQFPRNAADLYAVCEAR